ncbi:Beta-1,3-galactosyl-O-glycosyl-glycoprotein beta-1,6-N-acetylglucosaminyltransferase 4 [Bagarius yarrelli]|uniref:Beta-1,3-galactosyl-O-glycosyl-glycoprotein beta-1,6-N-acetylglucosaminyltransferase 4 n=1 Tax=Bagarius yarrelli TaxID=175774 RepID=A0A556U5H7_BAGYA|nr:Beta-1,3-galactosyl-O-glycosyl-glycoprotein beta-1,6-N-acetylglucosaminyltransferase 4 [Bagarius yarrelli]
MRCRCFALHKLRHKFYLLCVSLSIVCVLKLVYVKVSLKKRFYIEPYGITVRSTNSQSNKVAIDCSAIYQLDPVEIGKSLEIRHRDIVDLDDESVVSFTEDCPKYLSARGYSGSFVTEEERDFPLAYSLVVHKNLPMVERIIRAIYSPTNIYCIHYDQKSSKSFIKGVRNLAKCFPNIIIASKLELVQYAHITRLRADLNCLSDLLRSEVKWKYAINLCGQDFPLKSNYELVGELKKLNGANMLESSRPSELKKQRFSFQYELKDVPYEYQKLPMRTALTKSPPPHGIEMFTGSAYFVLSRNFVQYVETSQLVKDFLEWSADTYSPDEHFWATLTRVPGVPGEIPRAEPDVTDLKSKTRLVKWNYLEGSLYPPCTGTHMRSVCIYGAAELRWLLNYGHWFANKFDPKVDPVLIQCLEEKLEEKKKPQINITTDPQNHRSTLPQIHRTTDQHYHRSTEPQINITTDPQNHRSTLPQIHRTTDKTYHIHRTTDQHYHRSTAQHYHDHRSNHRSTLPHYPHTTDPQNHRSHYHRSHTTTDPQIPQNPQNHRSTLPQIHRTTEPQINITTDPQNHRSTLPQIHRSTLPQIRKLPQIHRTTDQHYHRSTEPQINITTDPQINITTDPQNHRSTLPQIHIPQIHRSTLTTDPQNPQPQINIHRSTEPQITHQHYHRSTEPQIPEPQINTLTQIHRSTLPQIHSTTDQHYHRTTDQHYHRSTDPQNHRSTLPQIHRTTDQHYHRSTDPQNHPDQHYHRSTDQHYHIHRTTDQHYQHIHRTTDQHITTYPQNPQINIPHIHISTDQQYHRSTISTDPQIHITTDQHYHRSTEPQIIKHTTVPQIHSTTDPQYHRSTVPHIHRSTVPQINITTDPQYHRSTLPQINITTDAQMNITTYPQMAFPVDILDTVNPGSLEHSAKSYMSKLLSKKSEISDYISLPESKEIKINLCNVSFVPLYGADSKEKILAVFSPEKPLKAVGLYLLDRWWSAEDILKTADSSRTGLIQVRTLGERIVLYVLNRIIYRTEEMVGDDVFFPCHGEDKVAKIFWKNGNAIGFYSVQPEVSLRLSNRFLTQRCQLPVMDTIFIRNRYRGHGHGLQILIDCVTSFKKDFMGLSYPLSPAMYKVCKKYLSLNPEDTEMLWEIVGIGSPFQIARKIQATDPKDVRGTSVTSLGGSSSLARKKLSREKEKTAEKISRVKDGNPDVQRAEDDAVQEEGKNDFQFKESDRKDMIKTTTHNPGPLISDITHLHNKEQNNLTFHLSEIKNLNSDEDLQPSEQQQVVEVEIASETEEVQEEAEERNEFQTYVDQMLLNVMETSGGDVEVQKDKTTNKEDIVGVKMGEILEVGNIVEDTEEMDVEKEEAGAPDVSITEKVHSEKVKEKHTVEETDMVQEFLQETEKQESCPNNNVDKISTMTQQEENSDSAFSSGLEGKGGEKQRWNCRIPSGLAGTLNDQDSESNTSERAPLSSFKETIKSKSIKQTENMEVYHANMIVDYQENEEEIYIIEDVLDQPTNNDLQDKVTEEEKEDEAGKILEQEDDEQISLIDETDKMVANEKGTVLDDKEGVSEWTVTNEENMRVVQKETNTAQVLAGEKTQSLHLFESSENDECDRSDVSIKLDEEEENKMSSVTPPRRSRRLMNQEAEGKLTKSVLRRSTRLSNKATPEKTPKPQIKAKEPDQQESKNDEINAMLESEVAVGEHTESGTVHEFAKGEEETAVTVETLGMDPALITNNKQNGKKYIKNNLEESQESTAPAQGDSVQAIREDEDISVCTSRSLVPRTLPVTPTPERMSRSSHNIYNKTKVLQNTQKDISDDEDETVFTRYLRGRIITGTPRRRSKYLTATEKVRTAVEEVHETNSQYDSPVVSEVNRKHQQRVEGIPGDDSEKTKAGTDEGSNFNDIERIDEDNLAEVDLNQEKEEGSGNFNKSSDQYEKCLEATSEKDFSEKVEERNLERTKDRAINRSITEAVLHQSKEAQGVDKIALRKQTVTTEPASARRSEHLRRRDQRENDRETIVQANIDQEKEMDDINTICGEISHDHEDQEITEGEKTYTNTNISQENTVTLDTTEFVNVSEEHTQEKLVEENVKEKREGHSLTEDIMESVHNAADKHQALEDIQQTPDKSKRKAEKRTPKSVTSPRERRSRRLLQDSQSETRDNSEAEEVKEVIGRIEEKKRRKRKPVAEPTLRRSKRFARAEIE